tara:strand:- start:322 stop:519 length:198 start_codon:yes stop_codon:yes gene_type:complete
MQNPAAIHITKKPQTKNEKVFNMYATSASTPAYAEDPKTDEKMIVKKNNFLNIFPPFEILLIHNE